jgi:hypothetical protein
MATVNLTRKKGFHKKAGISVMVALIDLINDAPTSADVYEIAKLPKNSLIIDSQVVVDTASDAATTATGDFGYVGAASALGNDLNLKSAAGTSLADNLAAAILLPTGGTVIFTPTYDGAATVGKVLFIIEYIELDKTNGEFTEFSST